MIGNLLWTIYWGNIFHSENITFCWTVKESIFKVDLSREKMFFSIKWEKVLINAIFQKTVHVKHASNYVIVILFDETSSSFHAKWFHVNKFQLHIHWYFKTVSFLKKFFIVSNSFLFQEHSWLTYIILIHLKNHRFKSKVIIYIFFTLWFFLCACEIFFK